MYDAPNSTLVLLYSLIIVFTFFIFWQRRRFYKISRQFPGPLELPFLGVFHRMPTPEAIIPKLRVVIEVYKTLTIFTYFGPQPVLYTTDPVLMEKVFTSAELYNKPNILYAPISHLFGDGLFSAKATKWYQHRKLINPSFRLPVLRKFLPVFNRHAIELKTHLDQMLDSGHKIKDFNSIFQKLTLTAAMETMLGRKVESGAEVDDKIVKHYTSVVEWTVVMVLLNFIGLSGLAKHFNFFQSRKAVFSFVNKLLKSRWNVIYTNNNNNNNAEDTGKEKSDEDLYFNENRQIFIDRAFKSYERQQLNWQDVIDESNSLIFAAFETTASAMSFALTFLAMHPDIQEKLFDEIKSIFPDKNFHADYEQLQQCTYMDMVINETLRLAPSVPTIARDVVKDIQLTEELTLPKGLMILVSIFQAHRNTSIWGPNADKFDPDNFLPEKVRERQAFSYLPFSKGIRNCIGGRYAILAVKVVLLHTLRNYRLSTNFKFENLEFVNHITLKLKHCPQLELHRRDN